MCTPKIILAGDPGKNNYAITILQINEDKSAPKILYSGYLENPISNLLDKEKIERLKKRKKTIKRVLPSFQEQIENTYNETKKLMDTYKPDLVVMERFQGRGLKGNLGEMIPMTIMIFFLLSFLAGKKVQLVTAAQWKNELKKQVTYRTLDTIYSEAKQYKLKAHQIDSTLIGVFASKKPNCYGWLRYNDKYFKLFQDLQSYENK